MTKFAAAALALCVGFSGLNVAEAATTKPAAATPAAVKPATTAKPAAATPAAAKPTTTAFGAGVWRTVQTTQPNPQTGVWSSDVQYISFGANGHFSEEIVSQGGNGQTGAGGVIDIVGTYKALSKTSMDFTMTSAALCVVYCQASERSSWGTSLDFAYKTLAPGEIQGAGGSDWTEVEP